MERVKKLVTAIAVMGFVNCYGYAAAVNSQSIDSSQKISRAFAQLGQGVPVMASTNMAGYDPWYGSMFIMSDGVIYTVDVNWNILYLQNIKDMPGYPREKGVPVAGFMQPGYHGDDIYQYYIFSDGSMYQSWSFYGKTWSDTGKSIYDMEGYPHTKGVPVAAFEWTKNSDSFRMVVLADGSVYRFKGDWKFEADPGLTGGNIKNAPDYPKDKGVPVAAYQAPDSKSNHIYFIFADGSHYKINADASPQWQFLKTSPNSIYNESGYPKLANGLQVDLSLEHNMSLLGGTYKIYNNSKNQVKLKVKASVYSENEYYERTYYDFDINQLMGALTLYDQQDGMKPQHFSLQRNDYLLGTFNQTRALSSTVELGELVNHELKLSDKIEKSGYIYFTSAAEQYHLYNLCIKYMEDKDRSNGGTCNKQTVLVEGKVPLQFSRSSFGFEMYIFDGVFTYTENNYRLIDGSVKIKSIYNRNASIHHLNPDQFPPKQKFNQATTSFSLLGHSGKRGHITIQEDYSYPISNVNLKDEYGCYDRNSPLIVEDEYGNTSNIAIDFGYGKVSTWYAEGKNLSSYYCLNNWG